MSMKHMKLANKVQIVINTIQDIDIKASFDTMNHLMGAIQTLAQIRDELNAIEKDCNEEDQNNEQEAEEDGNADV